MQIAIVGAGPIGLEAALAAVERGHEVRVFERGRVAENVRQWGHVRLFSPFGMNASQRGRGVLRERGHELPPDDALLTGREFAELYLLRLARTAELVECVREASTVHSIGRTSLGKHDAIGKPSRVAYPFRILVQGAEGEYVAAADVVLECSGTYPNHRWLGPGGTPCIGERASAEAVDYQLPDVLGRDRERFAGRTTLVIGSGYSAATVVVALIALQKHHAATSVTWVTRDDDPLPRVEGDPLPGRDELAEKARAVMVDKRGHVWIPGLNVNSIARRTGGGFVVGIDNPGSSDDQLVYDNVVANVGYKPDRSLYEELQVHECYASQGPIKLAASLLGETSGDCLAMESPGPDVLRNPEPNFFILGSKSYGRDSRFLLRTGLQQVEDVFDLIVTREGSDAGRR